MMDKRIGYGLPRLEAIEKALDYLRDSKVVHFSFSTDDHRIIWGEARDDGWRVYVPRGSVTKVKSDEI